ncbi:lysine--tRNA ligase [bacterium]|nr:lysine--tRNA ligase [bacterium]
MFSGEEIKNNRIKKMQKLIQLGFNPFPQKTGRNYSVAEAQKQFSTLSRAKKIVILSGRIRAIRLHGGACFLDIEDGSGKIQALLRKDNVGKKSYQIFEDLFDIGDFVEIRGNLFKTKRGEKTLQVNDFKMLSKSLRPLPEKWHGLVDIEQKYRKRYLDLIFNPEVKEKFRIRSQIIKYLREFLDKNGFLEVETPILQPIYGGARARPFKTHLNALNIDLYLRISPELYLKRLLVGGLEKVYEIGKCFRNEGVDKMHNPDFTELEFYWAYADYKNMMQLTEKMFSFLLKKIFKKLVIEYESKKINFAPPYKRLEFFDLFKRETKLDLEFLSQEGLRKKANKMGLKIERGKPKAEIADEIYKKLLRPKILQPTFLIHYPVGFQPLAKASEKNPKKLANFQLIVAGIELVNAFSELNNPIEQRKRFEEQEKLYKKGLPEAQRMDKDFLEALEYGMPPAVGFGMGIDRLVALLTDSHSLREVILFPTMRPR